MTTADTTPTTKPKANWRFMSLHPAHLLAFGFGSGVSPFMPGTMGTLLAWASFSLYSLQWPDIFTPLAWGIIIIVGFIIGVWASDVAGKNLGIPDHGSIVIDEIIAFWLVLLFLWPADFTTQALAFIIFRFFDIVKPQPIRYFDETIKGGLGVMVDDIGAAFYTLLVFALWQAISVQLF